MNQRKDAACAVSSGTAEIEALDREIKALEENMDVVKKQYDKLRKVGPLPLFSFDSFFFLSCPQQRFRICMT